MKSALAVAFVAWASLASAAVSFESLLAELNDRDALTRYPEPAYAMRLWSSHARTAETPGTPDWFDNHDFDNFVGAMTNAAGLVEHVLVDAKGPGALVRFWFAGHGHFDAVLRIYLDGADEPVVEGPLKDIVGGSALCDAPLSAALAPTTAPVQQARNLYLPIPFARGCRVTAAAAKKGDLGKFFYYNIEARAYRPGTQVTTLTRESLASARDAIAAANAALADVAREPQGLESRSFDGVLKPDETRTVRFDGAGAIRLLRLKSVSTNEYSTRWWKTEKLQLRKLRLELAFDGETTVRLPAGAFFNTGYWAAEAHETRFTRMTSGGVLEARWVMPFARTCELRLTNEDDVPIVLSDTRIVRGAYRADARTLRFGATYVARPRQPTRVRGEAVDLTLADLKGRGVLAGVGVIVENAAREWWGEGDEKIFVDGERVPSYIGTGTEDYFGYAWCKGAPFAHPLLAQPRGDGNGDGENMGGYTVNFRGRALDAIPFTSALRHDIELWHWADTRVDYDSVAYHYTEIGGHPLARCGQ